MPLRLLIVSLGICSVSAIAESTDCTTPVLIIPDGRLTQSTFPQNTMYWYAIYAQAGHSYSLEFEPPAGNFLNVNGPQFSPLVIFGPNDYLQGCRGNATVRVTQNSGYAPVILKNGNGAGRRVSFTAQNTGLHVIPVTNSASAGTYTFRAVDTTLFSPRWTTSDGKDVQWGFLNVSDMPITGTLTLFDGNGLIILTAPVSIPPGGRTVRFTGSSDLNLGRNGQGSAIFAHNGPPYAILGDAFLVNSTGVSPFPVKFETLAPR